MRILGGLLGFAAIVGLAWILSLPSEAECTASGRVVDPTERHCEHPGGYQQLEEHAFFHASHVAIVAVVVLAAGLVVRRFLVRRSAPPTSTA